MPFDESGFLEPHRNNNTTQSDNTLGVSSNGLIRRTDTNTYIASKLTYTEPSTGVTFSFTDGSTYTFPAATKTLAASDMSNVSTVGSGSVVLGSGTTQPWTPVLTPTSGSFTTVTYSTQYGRYNLIGNICYWHFDIILSAFSLGTASGNLTITGLPNASIGNGNTNWVGGDITSNVTFSGSSLVSVISGGTSAVLLVGLTSGSGTSIVQSNALSSSANIYASGFYLIA